MVVGIRAGDELACRLGVAAHVGENRGDAHDDGPPRKSVGGTNDEGCGGRLSWWRSPA